MKNSLIFLLICVYGLPVSSQNPGLKDEMSLYFDENEIWTKNKFAQKIIKMQPEFDSVYSILQQGKSYSFKVKTGFIETRLQGIDGRSHYVLIYVPVNYDPQKKYPVKIWLHGGMGGYEETARLDKIISRNLEDYKKYSSIMVYPAAWYLAPWTSPVQTENIRQAITFLKQQFNVDENRISLSGCSDGGTGTFYFANTVPTSFSNFTSTIGCAACLGSGLNEKEFYPGNLNNKPFFVINTGKDEIFKIGLIQPFMEIIKKNSLSVNYQVIDTANHICSLGPEISGQIQFFVKQSPKSLS